MRGDLEFDFVTWSLFSNAPDPDVFTADSFNYRGTAHFVPEPPFCFSTVTTVDDLKAEVDALDTSTNTINTLTATVDKVQESLDTGNNEKARIQIRNFISEVINRSNLKETNSQRIPLGEANGLICGAANVLFDIPLP